MALKPLFIMLVSLLATSSRRVSCFVHDQVTLGRIKATAAAAARARTSLSRRYPSTLTTHDRRTRAPLLYSVISSIKTSTTTAKSSTRLLLTLQDYAYMRQALDCAKRGVGYTFPNPAVGCVLVRHTSHENVTDTSNGRAATDDVFYTSSVVIGQGFHPRAGFPHAEVFALLEAANHVPCGVAAAEAVVQQYTTKGAPSKLSKSATTSTVSSVVVPFDTVADLARQYSADGGAMQLFSNCCCPTRSNNDHESRSATTVTAYVTLEPCCHTSKRTPPCASALVAAGVSRVVIGSRDPNPRVDGGGVNVLLEAGIKVQVLLMEPNEGGTAETDVTDAADTVLPDANMPQTQQRQHPVEEVLLHQECGAIISNFYKRIALPLSYSGEGTQQQPLPDYMQNLDLISGRMRRELRGESARRQQLSTLPDVAWGGASLDVDEHDKDSLLEAVDGLELSPEWMEHVDSLLWQHELVVLRLGKAVNKRKGVECLGLCIAQILSAHVAQSKGHTVLLYRPGRPPILQLQDSASETHSE